MTRVRATAVRWECGGFPGWLEVVVVDASGREHRIVEKAPVLTSLPVEGGTEFPVELWIDVEVEGIDGDEVTVSLAHGVETTDGTRRLIVSAAGLLGHR